MDEDKNMNPMHTFWIFGLGLGIGEWFITGKLSNLITGFLIGMVAWFLLLITIWPPLYRLSKWIIKKIG